MSRQIAPEPWATPMLRRGLEHRGLPSMTALAAKAGVSVETVRQMIFGGRLPEVETVAKVADALQVDVRTVSEWVGRLRSVREPWVPPAESALLTRRERDALDALIRAMTERQGESRGNTTPNTQRHLRAAARDEKPDRGTRPSE